MSSIMCCTSLSNCAPIKLRSTPGNLDMLTVEGELKPTQIRLLENLLWDILQINWH